MFEQFYKNPSRVQSLRDGPGGPLLEKFAEALCKEGYREATIRRRILAAKYFLYWADQEGVLISDLTDRFFEDFDRCVGQCNYPQYSASKRLQLLNGARLFLKKLRDIGVITVIESTAKDPVLLTEFCQWQKQQRGTSDLTLCKYRLYIRDFLKHFGEAPGRIDARSLRKFILDKSQTSGWAVAKKCSTALRMFVRFLIAEGKCTDGLDAAIPVMAQWSLSSLPRYLQPEEVERIITSCNPGTPVGIRDRAIILLLSRLGLRAGDIVNLHLDDIDWEEAEIYISGKGRCQARLPLTQEVGDAIVDYLQKARPQADTDVLFIRSCAPLCAFASHCAISVIVAQAMRRANVTCKSRGAAHILRHSAATSMLRQGASLQNIAAILRHHSIETSNIYAKVDVTTLLQIAQPWPEVKAC